MGRASCLILKERWNVILGAVLFFGAAFLLRLPGLGERPFHVDEATNAFIMEETLQEGGFHYRAQEHHGPTLFLLTEIPLRLAGVHSTAEMESGMLRLAAVFCSSAAVASVFLLYPYLSFRAAAFSAAIMAVAAPFHYYGRTFIHESLLLWLTILFLAALIRWRMEGKPCWVAAACLSAGLMILTKENAGITIGLLGLAFVFPWAGWGWWFPWKIIGTAGLLVLLIFLVTRGSGELAKIFDINFRKSFQSGHVWPWWKYLDWFVSAKGPGFPWSEWIVIGLAGVAFVFRQKEMLVLPLLRASAGLFLFYSFLPYKTPWLILASALPLVLLAGVGMAQLLENRGKPVWVLAAALFALMFQETWARSFQNQVALNNPMAYSPSDPEIFKLEEKLDAAAAKSGKGKQLVVQVVAEDYWPLPWVLRKYPNTGFWAAEPEKWPGDILLCSPEALAWIPEPETWTFEPYFIRPGLQIFLGTKR